MRPGSISGLNSRVIVGVLMIALGQNLTIKVAGNGIHVPGEQHRIRWYVLYR